MTAAESTSERMVPGRDAEGADLFAVRDLVFVVTGAGRGIGRWLAEGLAQRGASVVVASRTASECEEVAARIRGAGGDAIAVPVDLNARSTVESLMSTTVEHFGRLDVLVNNAGQTSKRIPALEVDDEDLARTVDTNVKGTYVACQEAARVMARQGHGRIINFGSTAAALVRHGVPNSAYAASKAAVVMMTKALAEEWATLGISVNCVAPGRFLVDRNMQFAAPGTPEYETVIKTIPMRRTGQPRDVLGPVIFFASEASSYVTGQTLFVDGGRTVV